MKPAIIEARNVGKTYYIGKEERPQSLRESILRQVTAPIQRLHGSIRKRRPVDAHTEFHALKDVSFDVYQGESLGVVGPNGSGKSTLLKILSNIVQPSTGKVTTWGKITALLEVSTGFNLELTGRENVYLKGVHHGLSKGQVRNLYEKIVSFADVGPFMNTPVKRYSTGMLMRLGMSVSLAMRPDVLIIDEVFAVGDAAFRELCVRELEHFHRDGGTLIVVTHSANYISRLCERALLLDHGRLAAIGKVDQVLEDYDHRTDEAVSLKSPESSNDDRASEKAETEEDELPSPMKLGEIQILNRFDKPSDAVSMQHPFAAVIDYEVLSASIGHVQVQVRTFPENILVLTAGDADADPQSRELRHAGNYSARVTFPPKTISHGIYWISVFLANPKTGEIFDTSRVRKFSICDTEGSWNDWYPEGDRPGLLGSDLEWIKQETRRKEVSTND